MKKLNKLLPEIFLSIIVLLPTTVSASIKDETVYANMLESGKQQTVTVVNKLSYQGEEKIEDDTELKEILNINGKEKYTLDGNKLIWNTDKKDIYYQGKTKKELPITMNIDYYLDGKKMTPKRMKGKKGEVKIVVSFQNHVKSQYQGKTIYTPFVVTLGTIIDGTKNTDMKVSNGKVIETGTKSMVIALASPGLYDSTKMETLKNMDQITMTYHTNQFQSESIYVVATPKLLDHNDVKVFDQMDQYLEKFGELETGTNALMKGSQDLANGTTTLRNEVGKKITELQQSDYSSVGITAKNEVEANLNQSLSTLVENTVYQVSKAKLNGTRDKIIESGIQTNCAALSGTPNYDVCVETVKQSITNEMILQHYQTPTYSEIASGVNQVISYVASQNGTVVSEENKNLAILISYQVSGILSTTDYAKYILSEDVYGAYILPTSKQVFQKVITSYGNIASSVSINTATTAATQTLSSLQTMYQAIHQVNDGAIKIRDGLQTLNESGIQKISNVVNRYQKDSSLIKELLRLSQNYQGFGSTNSKNTKFIYKIKSVK